jgi:hypothetical protein
MSKPKFKPIERKRSRGHSSRTPNVGQILGLRHSSDSSESQATLSRTITELPDGRSLKRARTSVLSIRERSPSPASLPPSSDPVPSDVDATASDTEEVGGGSCLFDNDSSWDAFDSNLGGTHVLLESNAHSDTGADSEADSDMESSEELDEDEGENLAAVRTD